MDNLPALLDSSIAALSIFELATSSVFCIPLALSQVVALSTFIAQSVISQSPMASPLQVSDFLLGYTAVGLGLLTGLFSLLFACLCFRIRRLTHLVQRREHQIAKLSEADPLTGLANRKQLNRIGKQLLTACSMAEIALLHIDLDRFKVINDALGREAGDELLLLVSRRLQSCTRPQDTLARIGGDEFALLLTLGDRADVCQNAERLLRSLSKPFRVNGQMVTVSSSVGIALTAHSAARSVAVSFGQLLRQADMALSQAKTSRVIWQGRSAQRPYIQGKYAQSHYAVFHPLMQDEAVSQAQLRCELQVAIARQELRVHYQPIVDLRNSQTIGFEALVRWQHPIRGLLMPSAFLPLAEEMGLTIAIDRWVMQTVCQQLSVWRHQSACLYPSISVNLSAAHLLQTDLVRYIQGLLSQYPIAPHQLNLEITESVMIADPDRVIDSLRRLKKLGLSVSLDDFGTGYSSLGYLHQFPVDVLKIDRSFVNALGTGADAEFDAEPSARPEAMLVEVSEDKPWGQLSDELPTNQPLSQDEVIIRAILDLAAGLELRVVAEGIERVDQLFQLRQMHCSHGQGNLFSKPMNAPSAHAMLVKAS